MSPDHQGDTGGTQPSENKQPSPENEQQAPSEPRWSTAAVVGAGTIGLSWAALFSAHGIQVRLTDPRDDLESTVHEQLPMLAASLSTSSDDLLQRIELTGDLREAVHDADIVQENGPEQLTFKRKLFADIAGSAPQQAVLASSSSGIVASEIARTLPGAVAERLLIAHPFNPPQVVPLVEIAPGERTAERTVHAAHEFYSGLGKTPVRIHKEVSGFVANRLQSALLQEAIHLVVNGVVDASELDAVMRSSLGGRWATVGPFESFHLGGGPGGIRHMMHHLGSGMAERWKDLGHPALTRDNTDKLIDQIETAYGADAQAYRERARLRDRKHIALNRAVRDATGEEDGQQRV